MDIGELKQYIIDNDKIVGILEDVGCANISNKTKEIRCSVSDDNNPTALRISKEYLTYYYFGDESILKQKKGDIITLIQQLKQINFKETLKYLKSFLNITQDFQKQQRILPFGGLYHQLKHSTSQEIDIETYSESILEQFVDLPNERFLKDGIFLGTQKKFNIGYDLVSNRITIPWRSPEGEITGVIGRYNGDDFEELNKPKYLPLIPRVGFRKSELLYGYYENYQYMVNNTILVFEAEKSVMILDSMSINNAIAIGSHNLSSKQIQLIQALYPQNIIICYDRGIEESHLIDECKKLQYKNNFFKCNVGYIYDSLGLLDEKNSPSDKGKEIFLNLIKNYIKWVKD